MPSDELRLQDLARDPARGWQITPGSWAEAEVVLALEEAGALPGPIRRDPQANRGDFLDGRGVSWDVKAFRSDTPPRRGGFRLADAIRKIENEFQRGQNVILDMRGLSLLHQAELQRAIVERNWGERILWYP